MKIKVKDPLSLWPFILTTYQYWAKGPSSLNKARLLGKRTLVSHVNWEPEL